MGAGRRAAECYWARVNARLNRAGDTRQALGYSCARRHSVTAGRR